MTRCAICGAADLAVFYRRAAVPVLANACATQAAAARAAARGDIELAHCARCDGIQNVAFDPARVVYDAGYENALHHSAHFARYADALAAQLAEPLAGADGWVVEVGCGQGEFLLALCRRAGLRGLGFDPALREPRTIDGVCLQRADLAALNEPLPARTRLVVARHVLEHQAQPAAVLAAIARAAAGDGRPAFCVEVPNAAAMIASGRLWDVIYEHALYFTPAALDTLLVRSDYTVDALEPAFDGQFLVARGTIGPGATAARTAPALRRADLDAFAARADGTIARWRRYVAERVAAGHRVVLWGVGSKGVSFLDAVAAPTVIAVDVNPAKHGRFVAGSGHRIVAPEALADVHPDVVLIANPVYRAEIARRLAALGLAPELVTI